MSGARRVVTASPASVCAAAGNLAEEALAGARATPQPEIDPEKQERVAVVTVTVALEVRDK